MNNVVLVGFMGSGKTTIGRQLAAHLHRPFIDLDEEIEADAGRRISEIFAAEGEAGFRERERRALNQAVQRDEAIIAAGGGAPLRDDNWRSMREGNTVVALMAEPAELIRRLDGGHDRPLLQPDPAAAITALLPERLSRYRAADLVVQSDGARAEAVASGIAAGLPDSGLDRVVIDLPPAAVAAPFHEVAIGRGLSAVIATGVQKLRSSGSVLIVSDRTIADQHAARLLETLEAAGISATLCLVPTGEAAKSLRALGQLYDALGEAGIDREGLILALGGGTVGDVAGFAAATWMRGIAWIQVPTTLLAMVDSSIGGKTGINLASGKNMAGAVHQPAAIYADLQYLSTLPHADYRASLAEVIKAALIADQAFADWLLVNMAALLLREPKSVQQAVTRSIRIKAEIVSRDPRESGIRAILNYGHTVGHALELACGYGALRHGDAIAWGMEVAARLSVLTGRCSDEVACAQRRLLDAAGLLRERPVVDRLQLLDALGHDKKVRSGTPRWVLLRGVGAAEYGCEVPAQIVSAALHEVLGL